MCRCGSLPGEVEEYAAFAGREVVAPMPPPECDLVATVGRFALWRCRDCGAYWEHERRQPGPPGVDGQLGFDPVEATWVRLWDVSPPGQPGDASGASFVTYWREARDFRR